MSFKNLVKRQQRMKQSLISDPIIEFKRTDKTVKIKRNVIQPIVFIISNSVGEPIYVGRATRHLSEAFSKFGFLYESDTLELFPFTREDAAVAFYRRILYHFNPIYNSVRKESNENS